MYSKKTILSSLIFSISLALAASPSFAESASKAKPTANSSKKASYTEDQFLNAYSGKSRKYIQEKLGKPVKTEQSVKPSGANTVLSQIRTKEGSEESNRVNVEMWYYNDLVNYDPQHKYKRTELTFVNDRCMNITFFNN